MVSARDHELLQRGIDGDLTAAERGRFEALLNRNPEAQKVYEELQAACAALASIPEIEPPRTLRPGVMRAIEALSASPAPARPVRGAFRKFVDAITTSLTKEVVMSPTSTSKKYSWLIAGAVVAIVAVVYFSFYYPPVPAGDAQGTIGAAQKYRSEQITDKDVVTGATATSPFAEQIMADANAMQQLGSAARDLGKAIAEYSAKPTFDKTIAADLGAAASALNKTIELGKNIGIQKSVAGDLLGRTQVLARSIADLGSKSIGKNAADLQRSAGALEMSASASTLNMTARGLEGKAVLEKSAVEGLDRAAVALNQAAVLYSTSKLERSAVGDMLGAAAKLEKSAGPTLEKNSTLDAKAVSELNKTAVELGKSAFDLGQKFPAEMRSVLEGKASLDSKQGLEGKAQLERTTQQ